MSHPASLVGGLLHKGYVVALYASCNNATKTAPIGLACQMIAFPVLAAADGTNLMTDN
jgi:hypothetical protein